MRGRRIALACTISALMVIAAITLVPRSFLVNDDAGLGEYLRKGVFTPWMSPVLVRALASLYVMAPDVPWYGIYLYFLIFVNGAVLIYTCIELIDPRPGWGHIATLIGAIIISANQIVLAIGITWTTTSISIGGTGVCAFVAHLYRCQVTNTKASLGRSLFYGMLVVACFTLRMEAIKGVFAVMTPLIAWVVLGFWRNRYWPRRAALAMFVAPFLLVLVLHKVLPSIRGSEYDDFNYARGSIHGTSAFGSLDTRAPEVLERAGWTVDEYKDFANWLFIDDTVFTKEKLDRLLATDGVPTPVDVTSGLKTMKGIFEDSAASVMLFIALVAGTIVLAWLGVIARRRSLVFGIGYLVFAAAVPLWMTAVSRFPQRVSLSFYSVAAFAVFVWLAYEVARGPAIPDELPADTPAEAARRRQGSRALLVMFPILFLWARNLMMFTDREDWPWHQTLTEFAKRVDARKGFLFVQAGMVELDPLQVDPHGYDGLPGGWGTFTALWYDYIHKFGFTDGRRVLPSMVDNPNAYLLASPNGRPVFEDWIRRQVKNPAVRLALVDAADGMPRAWRSELYRVVTTPMLRGTDEWKIEARYVWAYNDEWPGPPSVDDLAFRQVAFPAPAEQHLSPLRHRSFDATLDPLADGIRATLRGAGGESCGSGDVGIDDVDVGIRVPVRGLRAARFSIVLLDPENIVSLHAFAETASHRSVRWNWTLDPESNRFGFEGTFTLVPGYPANRLELSNSTAEIEEIRAVHVYVTAKPGSHAGFELHRFEVAEP